MSLGVDFQLIKYGRKKAVAGLRLSEKRDPAALVNRGAVHRQQLAQVGVFAQYAGRPLDGLEALGVASLLCFSVCPNVAPSSMASL